MTVYSAEVLAEYTPMIAKLCVAAAASAVKKDMAARQAALVRSAAQAPTLARDVTLARVLLAGQRAGVQPSAGATDAGGVRAEMELMDVGI